MIKINEIKVGNFIKLPKDNNIYCVTNIDYSMQGRGSSSYEVSMKIVDGPEIGKSNIKKRMNADDKADILFVEEKKVEYLYTNGNKIIFMDFDDAEQIEIDVDMLKERAKLLSENMMATIVFCESRPISINLPSRIEVIIEEAEPVVKGQTAASFTKNAFIKNGIRISVPQFVKQGDRVIISTDEIKYISKA